jgi:hypothetical protein
VISLLEESGRVLTSIYTGNGNLMKLTFFVMPARLNRIALLMFLMTACGCASSELSVPNVHTVVPGVLVRGGQPDEQGFMALQKACGIRTVVNLNSCTAASEGPMVTKLGMRYIPLPTSAFAPDPCTYLKFLEIAANQQENAPVYVHCKAGMDRTGMAVAAYRVVVQGWSSDEAMKDLRAHQEFAHTLLFLDIPFFVDDVALHRREWCDALHHPWPQHAASER